MTSLRPYLPTKMPVGVYVFKITSYKQCMIYKLILGITIIIKYRKIFCKINKFRVLFVAAPTSQEIYMTVRKVLNIGL